MRDISRKAKTLRTATAESVLQCSPNTIALIQQGQIPKGDPLSVAKVAAIQAAKNTSQIIPYCHPLPIDFVDITFAFDKETIVSTVSVKAIYKTGVEMEALTAASVAALTLYDMMKAIDDEMEILGTKLVKKIGGKSDFQQQFSSPIRAAVLVMSDSIAEGKKKDFSGQIILERLKGEAVEICDYKIIPDDVDIIEKSLLEYADKLKLDLIISTGGTGLSPRDCTPEAMRRVLEREIPGVAEAMRAYGQERTPYSMLSRSMAGVRGKTLIVNLPGSKGGVAESLDALLPALLHAFHVLCSSGHI